MQDDVNHGCGGVGRRSGLLCAGLGVVTAFLMFNALFGSWFFSAFLSPPILIGLIALFVAAAYLGTKAGVFLCKKGESLTLNVLVGIGLAFASIIIGVLAGSLSVILVGTNYVHSTWEFLAILFLPIIVTLLYGGVPALLLGVLYGFLVRNGLRRLGHYPVLGSDV